jgi:1-acyl-sn-glycerol-3-phosphate acyltransferase
MSLSQSLGDLPRLLFFALIVRPTLLIILGLNVRHRGRLPGAGPAVVVANHNSHLDTMLLMSLFPLRLLPRVRPVAARDYFLRNRLLSWFSRRLIGIIPIERQVAGAHDDPLAGIAAALEQGAIVIIFPEGSRGEPEQIGAFKSGVAHLARRFPELPFSPVFLHGAGKALPRGEAILVPFFCDVFVGTPLTWTGDRATFMEELTCRMTALAAEGHFSPWE